MLDKVQVADFINTITPWLTGGVAGSILTLLSKTISDNKQKKKLYIDIELTKFRLPIENLHNNLPDDILKVSYQGKEYDYLCLYRVSLKNTGRVGINNQNLVITIPVHSKIIKTFEKSSPLSIKPKKEYKNNKNSIDVIYSFDRLEPEDSYDIFTTLDSHKSEEINCIPRGVDNILYSYGKNINKSEIEQSVIKLILALAIFVLVPDATVFTNIIQSIIVITCISPVLIILNSFKFNDKVASKYEILFSNVEAVNDISIGDKTISQMKSEATNLS